MKITKSIKEDIELRMGRQHMRNSFKEYTVVKWGVSREILLRNIK